MSAVTFSLRTDFLRLFSLDQARYLYSGRTTTDFAHKSIKPGGVSDFFNFLHNLSNNNINYDKNNKLINIRPPKH